ncbi:hypothetical protein H7J81_18135 [Mycobacterium cookii]|nr:hypothetical protein [Mycobacterium cookii]
MMRQFGQQLVVGAGLGLQCCGDALMQPHASHRGQLGKQRLSNEGVVEPVAATGLFEDDPGLARLVERVDEILVGHLLHELECEPVANDGGRGKGFVRLHRKPRQPAAHSLSDTLRQRARIPRAPAFVDVAQSLDEKEGVAARHGCQCATELFVVVAGLGYVRADVILIETTEIDPVGCAVAVKVGEHRGQGVGPVQIGTAVGADDLHPGVIAEAQEVSQQKQCRLGCPVQVVEYKDNGRCRGSRFQ